MKCLREKFPQIMFNVLNVKQHLKRTMDNFFSFFFFIVS